MIDQSMGDIRNQHQENHTNLTHHMLGNSFSYPTPTAHPQVSITTPQLPPPSVPILISFENYSPSPSDNTHTPRHLYPHHHYSTATNSTSTCLHDHLDPLIMLTAPMEQMLDFSAASANGTKSTTTATRTPLQAQDHLLAERKRREKLSQLFITLSKLVPGLNKLDKASLLQVTINYLKSLQERVRILEEQASETIIINSESNDKDTASALTESNKDYPNSEYEEEETESPAEIKARILKGQDVLIKIYCKKQQTKGIMGLVSKIPTEVEQMNLRVIDMRVIPFGADEALDITILAKQQQKQQNSDATVLEAIVARLQALWFSPPA